MNYVKSCLIITMLVGVGYSQCNESNWEEYYPDMANCDLEGANLARRYLGWANLQGANLSGADLFSADVNSSDLTGADLSGAILMLTNFYAANLTDADLTDADVKYSTFNGDLTGADFSLTNCYGAFFVGANLNNTIFDGAHLIYAYFDENWDTYDDMSYGAGAESGDLNLDGVDNIQDVVILVNNILNP